MEPSKLELYLIKKQIPAFEKGQWIRHRIRGWIIRRVCRREWSEGRRKRIINHLISMKASNDAVCVLDALIHRDDYPSLFSWVMKNG